jgi:uncharacterized protein YjdB
MRQGILKLLLLLSFTLLSGTVRAQTQRPASIDIEPYTMFLTVGETAKASAKVYDQNGTEMNVPVSWISSPGSCASVDRDGMVTGVAPGQCRIGAIITNADGVILPSYPLVVNVTALTKRTVAWPNTKSAQNKVLAEQWVQHYRFVRNLSGAWAEFETVR